MPSHTKPKQVTFLKYTIFYIALITKGQPIKKLYCINNGEKLLSKSVYCLTKLLDQFSCSFLKYVLYDQNRL